MNKKLIAYKVSKHPLIKRLSEFVDNKTMARLIAEGVYDVLKKDIQGEQRYGLLQLHRNMVKSFLNDKEISADQAKELEEMLEQKEQELRQGQMGDRGDDEPETSKDKESDKQQPEGKKEDLLQSFAKRIEDLFLDPTAEQSILKFLKYILANAKALNEDRDKKLDALFKKFKAEKENSAAAELILKLMSQKPEVRKLISDFIKAVRTQPAQQQTTDEPSDFEKT